MAATASSQHGLLGSCVAKTLQTNYTQEALAHPVGREDRWSVPATRISSFHQFDVTDANGSQGRKKIKHGLVIMNSKAQTKTLHEDDVLEALCGRALDSMISVLDLICNNCINFKGFSEADSGTAVCHI